jgi:hypothetical protein
MRVKIPIGNSKCPTKNYFRSITFAIELGWLLKDGFYDMVTDIWQKKRKGSTSMEIWQNKTRSLRKYLKKTKMGLTRKRKKELPSKIDELDKKAEHIMLLPHEVDLRHCLNVWLI